jgi:hypothetical protein
VLSSCADTTYVVEEPAATVPQRGVGGGGYENPDSGLYCRSSADWVSSTITNIEEMPATPLKQGTASWGAPYVSAATGARYPTVPSFWDRTEGAPSSLRAGERAAQLHPPGLCDPTPAMDQSRPQTQGKIPCKGGGVNMHTSMHLMMV